MTRKINNLRVGVNLPGRREEGGIDNEGSINVDDENASTSKPAHKFPEQPPEPATTPSVPRWMRKDSQQPNSADDSSYQNSPPGSFSESKGCNDVEAQPAPEEPKKEKEKKWALYKGLFYSSLSSIFFSLSSVIVKYMTELHPGQLAVLRFLGIFVLTTPVLVYSQQQPFGPKKVRHFLIIRGIVGASSLFLRFYAFRYLPIADASVIVFSVPVFVAVFARIFLKEPCGVFHIISIFLTLLGIFLITKMPLVLSNGIVYTNERLYGVLAAIGSTFFGAAVYVVIRRIKVIHHSVIMFNFGWVAMIETAALTGIMGKFDLPKCGFNQWLVIILGIFSFAGQTLLTMALQAEHAAPVSIVRAAVDIVLAFIWQILFFHEVPDAYSISGALLVSICVLMISVRKWVLSLSEESILRKRLFFLTY